MRVYAHEAILDVEAGIFVAQEEKVREAGQYVAPEHHHLAYAASIFNNINVVEIRQITAGQRAAVAFFDWLKARDQQVDSHEKGFKF